MTSKGLLKGSLEKYPNKIKTLPIKSCVKPHGKRYRRRKLHWSRSPVSSLYKKQILENKCFIVNGRIPWTCCFGSGCRGLQRIAALDHRNRLQRKAFNSLKQPHMSTSTQIIFVSRQAEQAHKLILSASALDPKAVYSSTVLWGTELGTSQLFALY